MKSPTIKAFVFIEELDKKIELKICVTNNNKYYIHIGQMQKGPTVLYLDGNVRIGFTLKKSETKKLGNNISGNTILKLLGLKNDFINKYYADHLESSDRNLHSLTAFEQYVNKSVEDVLDNYRKNSP
jgi:hypothetical protein